MIKTLIKSFLFFSLGVRKLCMNFSRLLRFSSKYFYKSSAIYSKIGLLNLSPVLQSMTTSGAPIFERTAEKMELMVSRSLSPIEYVWTVVGSDSTRAERLRRDLASTRSISPGPTKMTWEALVRMETSAILNPSPCEAPRMTIIF